MKTYTYKGRPVSIIGGDTDPESTVWIYYTDEPDTDMFVRATDLVEA